MVGISGRRLAAVGGDEVKNVPKQMLARRHEPYAAWALIVFVVLP
jgi:hypothetical protein